MVFNIFKKKAMNIVAPLNGTIIPIEEVPDPVFSQKMMGDGIAIEPKDGHLYAPFSGEIIMVSPTKHAIALRSDCGVEVLIHIGLETVTLNGEGFQSFVKAGEQVKTGQLLIEVDWALLNERVESVITPIIVTKCDKEIEHGNRGICVQGETVILKCN